MPFDLDNDRTPEVRTPRTVAKDEEVPSLSPPIPLEPMSEYLEKLRMQGKVERELPPLDSTVLREARKKYGVVDEKTWALPGCTATSPRPPAASWEHDLFTERRAPQRIIVVCSARSSGRDMAPKVTAVRTATKTMVFNNLTPRTTVGDIKALVWSRLMPGPATVLVLESWGRELDDDEKTLLEYSITDDAKLQLRLAEQEPDPDRGLTRIRLVSTALQTRIILVEEARKLTGLELKQLCETALSRGTYEWYDLNGDVKGISPGVTLLAMDNKPEDENAGTGEVRFGEELIVENYGALSLRAGKGTVPARRMVDGTPCVVSDQMVAFLDLKADKMSLSFQGELLKDDDRLYSLGMRTDDAVSLEFESPALHPTLKLLRGPEPEKKAGGKKKK